MFCRTCEAMRDAMARRAGTRARVRRGHDVEGSGQTPPNKLLLVAQPDVLPWLSSFFGRIDFTQFTQTTQPFVVDTLALAQLSSAVVADSAVSLDAGLALAASLAHTEEAAL